MTHKSDSRYEFEWNNFNVDVAGKTVLDIGAHDGWFTARAVEEGAASVVAIDPWAERHMDQEAVFDRRCAGLPQVEKWKTDFMTCDLDVLGRFDVVLFMGVLYHLEEPFTALRRVHQVTGDLAVIESAVDDAPGIYFRFYPGAELNNDPSNWFVPTKGGMAAIVKAAGFSEWHLRSLESGRISGVARR